MFHAISLVGSRRFAGALAVASLDSHIWDDVGESFGEARAVTTRRVFVTHAVTP